MKCDTEFLFSLFLQESVLWSDLSLSLKLQSRRRAQMPKFEFIGGV